MITLTYPLWLIPVLYVIFGVVWTVAIAHATGDFAWTWWTPFWMLLWPLWLIILLVQLLKS